MAASVLIPPTLPNASATHSVGSVSPAKHRAALAHIPIEELEEQNKELRALLERYREGEMTTHELIQEQAALRRDWAKPPVNLKHF